MAVAHEHHVAALAAVAAVRAAVHDSFEMQKGRDAVAAVARLDL